MPEHQTCPKCGACVVVVPQVVVQLAADWDDVSTVEKRKRLADAIRNGMKKKEK